MRNLDTIMQEKTEVVQRIQDAMKSGDSAAFQTAFIEYTEVLQDTVLAQARGLMQANDQTILAGRGVRVLTSEETTYYQRITDAMRSSNPMQALTEVDKVLPTTVINTVFEDIQAAHPLLDAIDFQNTSALTEIIISTTGGVAKWGDLCKEITDELSASFAIIPLTLNKLSAFLPVCKAMLDLGPEWLDRYVRAVLTEAGATGLELGIVDGDGKDGPIGMTRKLSGATDGVYPRKDPITLTSLDAVSMGSILATLAAGPNGKQRAITEIIMLVNPVDYFTKVFPATTIRATDGTFVNNVLPFPTLVIPSAAVDAGHAVFGIGKKYFMGLGTSKGGKIEYSDEYKFLEDKRYYLIKLYGNGRAMDENAFVYADISGLKPAVLQVEVTNMDEMPTG